MLLLYREDWGNVSLTLSTSSPSEIYQASPPFAKSVSFKEPQLQPQPQVMMAMEAAPDVGSIASFTNQPRSRSNSLKLTKTHYI